jgi:hypothetical protein
MSADVLFSVNRALHGRLDSMVDSPVTVLTSSVRVDLTDPWLHHHYKNPFTPDQTLDIIVKRDPDRVEAFTKGMKQNGIVVIQVLDQFLDYLRRAYRLSVELTVAIVSLSLVRDKNHPVANRVQDVTQAWLVARDDQLEFLLTSLAKGVTPQVLTPDVSLLSAPGIARLTGHPKERVESAFVSYYCALFTALTYSSEGALQYVNAIEHWRATHEYKQRGNEALTTVLSRERSRWTGLVQKCQLSKADQEIPTVRARILNLSSLILPRIFTATEKRQAEAQDGRPILIMQQWDSVTGECLAEERR